MIRTEALSRREREMMNVVFQRGEATATEVMNALADPPSYSAVRATLRILEEKGHLRHEHRGNRYVYRTTITRERAGSSALDQLLRTFFDGSAASVVATLLESPRHRMTDQELERLSALIDRARQEGR